MATFTHPRLPVRPLRTDRVVRAARPSRRETDRTAAPGDHRTVTSRAVTGYDSTSEPRRAASVLPVLVAFLALVALSVAAAYFGREALGLLGSFLQG